MNCRKDLDSNIQTWSKSRFISDSIACIFENDFRELAEDGKDSGVKVSILWASLASGKTRSNTLWDNS